MHSGKCKQTDVLQKQSDVMLVNYFISLVNQYFWVFLTFLVFYFSYVLCVISA